MLVYRKMFAERAGLYSHLQYAPPKWFAQSSDSFALFSMLAIFIKNGKNMKKEEYITEGNLSASVERWLTALKPYLRYPFGNAIAERTAIIITDVQKCFFHQNFHAYIPASEAVLPNILKLAKIGAKKGAKIILTRHAVRKSEKSSTMEKFWGENIIDGTPESEIIPQLLENGDVAIKKSTYDAFYGTQLEKILRNFHIEWVAIAGVMTDICCSMIARSAFVRGFAPIVIADATATITEELQLSALMSLAHGVAEILSTEKFLDSLE